MIKIVKINALNEFALPTAWILVTSEDQVFNVGLTNASQRPSNNKLSNILRMEKISKISRLDSMCHLKILKGGCSLGPNEKLEEAAKHSIQIWSLNSLNGWYKKVDPTEYPERK
jgi:hypothetical protein